MSKFQDHFMVKIVIKNAHGCELSFGLNDGFCVFENPHFDEKAVAGRYFGASSGLFFMLVFYGALVFAAV